MTTPRLNPTEQRVTDALAKRGLSLETVLRRPLVSSLAAELGWTPAEVRTERNNARKQHRFRAPHRAAGKPRGRPRKTPGEPVAGPLPEAPTLPLGCTDAAVVARCQRDGDRWLPEPTP